MTILNQIVPLAKKLVSIKSTQKNTKSLKEILQLSLSNVKEFTIEQFEHNGIKSALIYNSPKRPKRFKVILNGHLDIIPGKEHQYLPQIKGDRLYGVGSVDMKASMACFILVFKEMANKVNYPLGLQLTTDEEVGGFNGTKYQIDKGVRADFVIAGETTNFNIVNKTKGILWVKISSGGKTAHGAYPWKGKNAIWGMNAFLNQLQKRYPVLTTEKWVTTVNLSRIETSNQTFNKIPDDCIIWLDIRFVPQDSNKITNNIKELLPRGFKLNIILKEPALFVDENNQYFKILQRTAEQITNKKVSVYGAQGSSDARHFTRVNCDSIEFGPVGGGIGTDNEWIDIPSLEKYHCILKEFLLSLKNL